MDKDLLALSLLAGGETAHSFSSFLPSSFTVKSFALDPSDGQVAKKVSDLRSGYRPAVLFGMGLASVIAFIARSPLPIVLSAATAVAMITAYEQNLPPDMRLNPLVALMDGESVKGLPVPKGALRGVSGV